MGRKLIQKPRSRRQERDITPFSPRAAGLYAFDRKMGGRRYTHLKASHRAVPRARPFKRKGRAK